MDYLSLLGIAIGLSMDAFAVSVTNGAVTRGLRIAHALKIAVCFGLFQAVMPMIGWAIGKAGEGLISQLDHWIAFVLLALIGGNMIREAFGKEEERASADLDVKTMFIMAVATSIDALAVGVTFAFLNQNMPLAVSLIGVTTFMLSMLGVKVGNLFGVKYKSKAEFIGGLILILLGAKILLEHLGIISI